MVEERQHEQNDRVLSSRADFGDRDRSHILGMGATEPPGVYRTSCERTRFRTGGDTELTFASTGTSRSTRGNGRTEPTEAGERTQFGKGGRGIELTFARTGTSRSARGDGFIKPTGAGERTQFGTGGGDTELTFACTGTSRSARGDGLTEPTGACERTRFGTGGDTELTFASTGISRSTRGNGLIQPASACERTRFGTGGGDTELTFACTGSSRSARGDGRTEPTGANEPSFGISAKDNPVRLVLGICPLESNKNRYGRLMGPSKNRSYLSTAQNCRQMIPFRSRYDSWTFTLEQRAIGIETDFSRVP
jgi:hypothetical protein